MPDVGALVASSQAGWMAFVTLLVGVAGGVWRAFSGEKRKVVLASYHDEVCGYYRDRAERAEAERDRAYTKLDDSTRLFAEIAVTQKAIVARIDVLAGVPTTGRGTVRDVGTA